ncbi:hypothetical protein J2S66_000666 [Saccharothrix longispora]|uniref:Uncharacterized protein n=1 Tax=Saccharothrix longispora TaxID=33920 RepID=A0ABU1PNN8_9PSEU|nr:hypothetical protein [Saccharothrix longispora]
MNDAPRTVYPVITAAPPALGIDRPIDSLHTAD